MSFYDYKEAYKWDDVKSSIYNATEADVIRALNSPKRTIEDFIALISPAAAPYLEQMATEANRLTLARFGKTIQMYLPLYLSNYCENACVYCGFSHKNKIPRKKLTMEEVDKEIDAIKELGYKHILLVSGEAHIKTSAEYYRQIIERIRPDFSQIAIEVQPLSQDEYAALHEAGLGYVCVYQETYNEERYPHYHPAGRKSDYRYRLETPDRVGAANVQKIGIGALLGLEDWRVDSFYVALHLQYLERTYWKTKYSISLPRLRPNAGGYEPEFPINDRELVQLICAYRLFRQEAEISLSTRESAHFRDHVMKLGVTSMSAGSSTEPGGYAEREDSLEQFSVNDARSPQEMAEAIKAQGYEPVWKDWDSWM